MVAVLMISELLFPACAGVIRDGDKTERSVLTFPRVCGGDPIVNMGEAENFRFSPRVRG